MSATSEQALDLLSRGRVDEATRLAAESVQQSPEDWHAHYALGQCLRVSEDYSKASDALSRADALSPRQPTVLLALGIARQLNSDHGAAAEALHAAVEIDPDFVSAYSALAMTQTRMGAFARAANTYDEGARALARVTAGSLRNEEDGRRVPRWQSRNDLWSEYAFVGGMHLAARDSVENLAWPSGEIADRAARSGEFKGWYWQDSVDADGKTTRLFLPNYFNTFCSRLRADSVYADLVGNRSMVLRLMGLVAEADEHLQEAQDFLPGE